MYISCAFEGPICLMKDPYTLNRVDVEDSELINPGP